MPLNEETVGEIIFPATTVLAKKEYTYTTGTLGAALDTISYGYGDSSWKNLLTSYDGQLLASDEIGNLANDGTWSYTWQHGAV